MTWQNWLEKYYERYKYHFIVQKLTEFPYPWLNYNTPDYKEFIIREQYVSQREVFTDEIIFDIDMDKELSPIQARIEAEKTAHKLSDRLKLLQYSHSVWATGGTGIHIHMFFPELNKLNQINNRIIRKQFIMSTCAGYIRPREFQGKVQLQYNTTIQLEEAPHRKGGVKHLLWEYNTGKENVFLPVIYERMEEEKVRNDILDKYFKEKNKGKKPDAIVFLENQKFINYKDGRNRAMFILVAYYKQTLNDEEVFKVISDWNKKQLGGYLQDKQIKSTIKSTKPGILRNYIITLFDELGIDESYLKGLYEKKPTRTSRKRS